MSNIYKDKVFCNQYLNNKCTNNMCNRIISKIERKALMNKGYVVPIRDFHLPRLGINCEVYKE